MTLLRVLVLVAIAPLFSACAWQGSAATKPTIPQTEAECGALGGNWTTLGLPYPGKPKTCDLKTTDAGKVCSDSSECQGSCIAPSDAASGIKAVGACSAYVSNFGNLRFVEHGKVEVLNVE